MNIKPYRIYTKINFVGDCEFKTKLPEDVFKGDVASNINEYKEELLTENEINTYIDKLKTHLETSTLTNKDHIRSLQKRHSSKEECPRCGELLAIKDVKRGAKAGRKFLGCSSFPVCRYTKSL